MFNPIIIAWQSLIRRQQGKKSDWKPSGKSKSYTKKGSGRRHNYDGVKK